MAHGYILSSVHTGNASQRHCNQIPQKVNDIPRRQAATDEITTGNGKWTGSEINFSTPRRATEATTNESEEYR